VNKLSRPMVGTERLSIFGLCFLLKLFKMQVNRQISVSTDEPRVFKQLGCIDLEKIQNVAATDLDQAGQRSFDVLAPATDLARRFARKQDTGEAHPQAAPACTIEVKEWTNFQDEIQKKTEGASKLIFRTR